MKNGGRKSAKSYGVDKDRSLKRYFFLAIIVLLIILSYFIVRPYLIALASAFILAYFVKPLYNLLNRKFPQTISALVSITILILLIIIPLFLIFYELIYQASLVNIDFASNINKISSLSFVQNLGIDISGLVKNATNYFVSGAVYGLTYLPTLITSLFIMIIGIYFILLNWGSIVSTLTNFIPLKDKEGVVKEISNSTHSMIYGTFLIGFLEFILAAVGFYLCGVKIYLLLAGLVFIFAFIPGGPGIVWIPLFIYKLFEGRYYSAAGILVIGLVISIYLDTLFRSKILGDRSNINPFVMLLGVIGGISVFGIFGFIIGPLILEYSIKILKQITA
jgi:predicted PurR-regulated permease PerM